MFPAGYTHKNALPKRSVSSRTISDYSPFGVLLPERAVNAGDFRYGFQGQEHDDEVKGEGNSYDFGARMYDPRVGRWLTIDAKASKYRMDSPYLFAGNNPITCIDPDGNEKIVVVGSENRSWNLTFVLPAMKKARELKKAAGDEQVTLLLFKAGYSDNQLKRIQKYVNKNNIKIQVVTSSDDLVNYINNKSITTSQSGRQEDPVTNISILAHGLPNQIAFGYHQGSDTEQKYSFYKDDVNKINASSFKKDATITSFACRTGASNDENGDVNPEYSLAQVMANRFGVTVYALQRRSDYENILPDDPRPWYEEKLWPDNTYDSNGGTWDTNKAIDKISMPVSGTSPSKSTGWTKFDKGKSPTVLHGAGGSW